MNIQKVNLFTYQQNYTPKVKSEPKRITQQSYNYNPVAYTRIFQDEQ